MVVHQLLHTPLVEIPDKSKLLSDACKISATHCLPKKKKKKEPPRKTGPLILMRKPLRNAAERPGIVSRVESRKISRSCAALKGPSTRSCCANTYLPIVPIKCFRPSLQVPSTRKLRLKRTPPIGLCVLGTRTTTTMMKFDRQGKRLFWQGLHCMCLGLDVT